MNRVASVKRVAMICLCLLLLLLLPAAASKVDCDLVNVSPVADFAYGVGAAETAPVTVNFYSTSTGGKIGGTPLSDPIETYLWRFGDGTVGDKSNPLHTYATSSARSDAPDMPYTVSLTVTTGCGRITSVMKNVSVYCLNQTAGFTILRPAGDGPYPAPVALSLKDTSLHVDDAVTVWHYTVWDAAMTRLFLESTDKDPTFIIRNGGSYVIRQEVFKGCSRPDPARTQMTQTIEVTGSAASDAIPMDTIPFTPSVTESPVTTRTPAPARPQTTAPAPVAVTPAPGTGTLSVNTSPGGARVFVNDVLLGSSPVTIPGFDPGSYQIRLVLEGYRNKTATISIEDSNVTEYATTLEAESTGSWLIYGIAVVIVIIAVAGGAVWYRRKKRRDDRWRALFPD